jgi:hypothetical protein
MEGLLHKKNKKKKTKRLQFLSSFWLKEGYTYFLIISNLLKFPCQCYQNGNFIFKLPINCQHKIMDPCKQMSLIATKELLNFVEYAGLVLLGYLYHLAWIQEERDIIRT